MIFQMRIIHVNKYYYDRAGAEIYMLDLMRLQEEDGHQVAPFSMDYPKNFPSNWSDYFVSEIQTEAGVGRGFGKLKQFKRALWSREAYIKMSKMIDVFNPDVVHVHNIYTQISPSILKACQKHKVPAVMTVHDYALLSANYSLWSKDGSMDLNKLGILATAKTKFIKDSFVATLVLSIIQKWHKWRRLYDKHIGRYFADSRFVKDLMVKNGYDEEKISVKFPFFSGAREEFARKDKGYILFAGRLEQYKGVQTLIKAMKEFPAVELKIAGSGNYEKELRKIAKGMKNVEFVGWISGHAKDDLQAGARVSVVPSIWNEPAGIVIFESLEKGVPVIVSDAGGMKEIVEDKISGRVFRAGDVKDLARVLREFIYDKSYADSIGESAMQRAVEIGNPEQHLKEIIDVYKGLMDKDD